jgi:DNA/RNA endonuclease G (NUC1)
MVERKLNERNCISISIRRAVEDGSRRLAADRNITLQVYTGTHGVLKLNDTDGIAQEIYLDDEYQKVPVPKIFYKILIDESRDAGVVLIGVNNPHATMQEINRDYVVCNDVSDKIKYIKWRATDIRRGFSYACKVDEFLRAVPHLKSLHVKSLLT